MMRSVLAKRCLLPRLSLACALAALTLWCLASACRQPPASGVEAAVESSTLASSSRALPATPGDPATNYLGVLVASRVVDISAEVEGQLESVDVAVGDEVTAGQRLAVVDTREPTQELAMARASLDAIEASVERARIELDKARRDHARRQKLRDVFSEEEVASLATAEQTAAATLASEQAKLQQEQVRIEQLRGRLARSILRAPITGRVALRYLEPGERVSPGMPVVRLVGGDGFRIRFAVPPQDAGLMRLAHSVRVRFDNLDLHLEGVITQIAPQIDLASQMLFAEADLSLPEAQSDLLHDGLIGRVMLGADA